MAGAALAEVVPVMMLSLLFSAALFPALAVKLLPAGPAEPAQGADESAARVPALLSRRTREFL
jgi:hypothetical protein